MSVDFATHPLMHSRRPVSLNLNVRGMAQSATLAIKERCRELRGQDRHIYDFGLGQSPFPVPTPVVEALRLAAPQKEYLPVKGLPALRQAVAEFHRKRDQINVQADGILIGPGSKELMFLLQLCYYGEIILRTPCWVSYLPQARIIGRRISLIRTTFESRWKLTPEQLLETFEVTNDVTRPRLLVLNYPSNPTGHAYTEEELRELAEVARKFEVILLSDEIYGQLHHKGEHLSIARFYPERTIVSSGLSKWCGAGGWRLGTFAFPPELDWLQEAMAAVASETYTSVCAPVQYAAVHAFQGGVQIERYLWHTRRLLATLADRCVAVLRDAGLGVHRPAGAFYLYLDFSPMSERLVARGIHDGASLCTRLLEQAGVALLPGVAFGQPRSALTARLSYVDFDGDCALAASENVPLDQPLPDELINRCCANVIEGVERLAEWVSKKTAREHRIQE